MLASRKTSRLKLLDTQLSEVGDLESSYVSIQEVYQDFDEKAVSEYWDKWEGTKPHSKLRNMVNDGDSSDC